MLSVVVLGAGAVGIAADAVGEAGAVFRHTAQVCIIQKVAPHNYLYAI